MIISIDGELVAPARAVVPVTDRGFLYGDGLFEVLRTWRGVAVELDAHLARLAASAAALQITVPTALRAWVLQALSATATATATIPVRPDHRVRIVVTRGEGGLRARLADVRGGHAIIYVEPLEPMAPGPAAGVRLAVVDRPVSATAGHKTLAYLEHLLARELAVAAGADDAVRLDARGEVAECATSNIFLVHAGRVSTPPLATGALPGIVRARVLAACARLGVPAAATAIALTDLRAADELFVTSSVRGVVPVTALDGRPRAPGPVTIRLAADHDAEMSALAEAIGDRSLL